MKPSVTELIGMLDKPGLLNWANKIGLDGIKLEDYRKKSMINGTSLHKQIEDYKTKGAVLKGNSPLDKEYAALIVKAVEYQLQFSMDEIFALLGRTIKDKKLKL